MLNEDDSIKNRLDEISESIVSLTKKVSLLEQRINLENKSKELSHLSADTPPVPNYNNSLTGLLQKIEKKETSPIVEGGVKFYADKKETKEGGFEKEIGSKWFSRAGILALLFGVAFFLKYVFDNNFIDETGRVVIGILSGMVLLCLGDYLRQKYTSYASNLTGGGIALLYLSIYSGFAYYQLIDQIFAFAIMSIVTAIGAFLAIRYERINLAVLSILGGFLTPLLLSTGTNNQIGLFSYMTILNLGVLAISFYRNWQKLNLLGFLATLFLYFGWAANYYKPDQLVLTEAFLILWFIIYSVAIVSHNILSRKKTDFFDLVLIVLNALVYFGISYYLLLDDYGDYLGFFAILMAAVYFIFAYISYQVNSEDKQLALFFPGISIVFLTIAAPIQFDGVWVTISWAVEAVILVLVGLSLKKYSMRLFSNLLLGIVVIRLIFIDSFETVPLTDFMLFFNKRFLTFMIGVASFSIVYYLYSKYEVWVEEKELKFKAISLFLLNFLLLWNLSAEVSVYFSNKASAQYKNLTAPQCEIWNYNANGNNSKNAYCVQQFDEFHAKQDVIFENIKNSRSMKNASLTVLWALYAIGLLAFGIRNKNRLLRYMGTRLFIVVILKLFLSDLWNIGGVWRIVAFISLAAILLLTSFAYNKYRDKIKEII